MKRAALSWRADHERYLQAHGRESVSKDTVRYTEDCRATRFSLLWQRRVRLAIGKEAKIDYTMRRRVGAFRGSSLVERETYTATAVCLETSTLFVIKKEALNKTFLKHPESGTIFYRRLAGAVVQRLIST